MSDLGQGPLLAIWGGAALLFLLQIGFSTAIASVSALNRVALRRMSQELEQRYPFLEQLHRPLSSYRLATILAQRLCLLGASALLVLGATGSGWPQPVLAGLALATLIGPLLIDGALARLIAAWQPRAALRSTAVLVRAARTLLYPLVLPLVSLPRWMARRQSEKDDRDEEDQEDAVEALIEVGEREGLLEASEGAMMRSIVDLDETRVRELMTPRIDIVALPVETNVAQARRKFLEGAHSRLPVYRSSIDNVVGVLHARDLFQAWEEGKERESVAAYLRPAIYVPEPLSAARLLAEMRTKTKLALVVDEYGGVSGLVTLEDVLEEIVGEIRDEHEQHEEELVEKEADGSYSIKAIAHVEQLEELFGVDFEERDFDTVGGLVVSAFGRVPVAGEKTTVHGLEIEVLHAGRRRVHRVRIRPATTPAEQVAES